MSFKEKVVDLEISILETERLILRPWAEEDAGDLYCYASHPDVGHVCDCFEGDGTSSRKYRHHERRIQ